MRRLFSSPVHICIVGALVLSFGIYDLVELIGNAFLARPQFNLGFLLIFVGLGLLRGSSVQRNLFYILMALGLVVKVVVFLFWFVTSAFSGDWDFPKNEVFDLIAIVGIYLYCFLVLGNARNDPWFAKDHSGKVPQFVIPITVVLASLYAFASFSDDYTRKKIMAEIYRYDLDIEVVDKETGGPIKRAGIGRSGGELRDLDLPEFVLRKSSSSSNDPRVAMTIRGFAKGEMTVSVSADGYEGHSVKVSKLTKSPLRVELNPSIEEVGAE